MNGAECLLETLVDSHVEVCFANPGTSEMQLVAAIGKTERMRAVLCLFEGVVSAAADGYARMTDRPAATLLHLGSGYANSMANQHNAMRAHVPLLNIVGEHATWHMEFDAPLTSDIQAHAQINSAHVEVSSSCAELPAAGARAVAASMEGAGKIATLIVPANHAWETDPRPASAEQPVGLLKTHSVQVDRATDFLRRSKHAALFLGGRALREEALELAGKISRKTGCRIICETFAARIQRGAGRVSTERLPYFAEGATAMLEGLQHCVLVGAKAPVSFFAYPGKPGWLLPEECEVTELASVDHDPELALEELAQQLEAEQAADAVERLTPPEPEPGPLTPSSIGLSMCSLMPEHTIVSDEAATCGLEIYPATTGAAAHDWLMLTGGAIGQGLPLALGAAIASPERKVLALQADGSAMYTLQALWSMAREQTDVTIVLLNNRSYAILNIEMMRVGAEQPTAKALSMLDLSNPNLDWVALAEGMGVPATRADDSISFHRQLEQAMQSKGPRLIEAMVTQQLPG